ncbi:MAG: LysR substrate-binding domain-containing protein [Gammaproteobacteria bacterium]|nr:LysR substrate-binding domain-containing protein [Gammaproteobacteria bacterium]
MSNTPPLQLLPAFEAAARLLSFKAAADELCVTPSAVSQQIKTLENLLGKELFQRSARQVTLTEAGTSYYEVASKTLNRFKNGHQRWLAAQANPTVRLSTTAQIAFDILLPALPEFHEKHPDIDLRIETTDKLADFETEAVDIAIRLGDGQWSGLHCERLSSLSVCGLAAPSLLASQPITSLRALKKATLIHARTNVNDWEIAEQQLGISLAKNKQLYFENYHAALSATENGMGIALGLLPLTQPRINSGKLQTFGAPPLPLEQACYLVFAQSPEVDSETHKATQWVQDTFANLSGVNA